jgi:hypothetical protein
MDTFFRTAISFRTYFLPPNVSACILIKYGDGLLELGCKNGGLRKRLFAYHMFSPRHKSFVDDFGGIVAPGVNMDTFFDN